MSIQQLPMVDAMSAPADDTTTPRGAFFSALVSIELKARAYLAEHLRQRAIRRAEAQLHEFDDRLLKDIGLSRGEIHSAVRAAEREFLLSAQPK